MEEVGPAPDGFSSGWDAVQLAAIEYPLKFELAAKFMASHPSLSTSMSIEDQLMFYGLHQQATLGPCNIPRPHLWQRVECAKWDIWKELGNMSKVEAMFLYTRSVEEKCVHWAQWHAIAPDIAEAIGLKGGPRTSAPAPCSPPSRMHESSSSPAFDSPPQSLPPGNDCEYVSPVRAAPSPPTLLPPSKVRSKVPELMFELSPMPEINFSLPFDSLHPPPHPAAHTWGAECASEPVAKAPRVYTEMMRRGDEGEKQEELRLSTEMQAAADPAPVLSPFEMPALDVFPPLSAASPDPTEHGASRKDKAVVEEAKETPRHALAFGTSPTDVFSRAERGVKFELPRPMISTANWAQRWSLDIFSPVSAASPLSAASALRFTSEPLRFDSSPDPTEHEARRENKTNAALEEAEEKGQGLIALAGGPVAKSRDIETPATALSTYSRQSTGTRGEGGREGGWERGREIEREAERAKVRCADAAVSVH